MSTSFAFEQLESSAPLPPGAPERIIAEATEQAAAIREQARAQGYEEGRAAGHQDGVA
jgi:flagellar biosynthesis/type III secretory pathway protein FliH